MSDGAAHHYHNRHPRPRSVDILLDSAPETSETPPERWKNRYLVTRRTNSVCVVCGKSKDCYEGDDYLVGCCVTFPSRAAAEKNHSDNSLVAEKLNFKYLGPIRL